MQITLYGVLVCDVHPDVHLSGRNRQLFRPPGVLKQLAHPKYIGVQQVIRGVPI